MREAGAFEAENKLGTLLDWVASGEEVLITRHGKAVARLVSATPTVDRAKARMAARGLFEGSRGITLGGRISVKDLATRADLEHRRRQFRHADLMASALACGGLADIVLDEDVVALWMP